MPLDRANLSGFFATTMADITNAINSHHERASFQKRGTAEPNAAVLLDF